MARRRVAVDLHFLESGVVGRAPIEGKRLEAARIEGAASSPDGIGRERLHTTTRRHDLSVVPLPAHLSGRCRHERRVACRRIRGPAPEVDIRGR